MALKDMLDKFFGVSSGHLNNFNRDQPDGELQNDDISDENGSLFGNDGFRSFTFGMDPSHEDDMFAMLDRLMRGFNNHQFFPGFSEGGLLSSDEETHKQKSLRDQILKTPGQETEKESASDNSCRENFQKFSDHTNFDAMIQDFFGRPFFAPFLEQSPHQPDTDLDEDVQRDGLESILKSDDKGSGSIDRHSVSPFSRPFSGFQSMSESRSMIRRSDGSTEERITRRSSDDVEETTIITQTPTGERRTEVRRDGVTVEMTDDNNDPSDLFNSTSSTPAVDPMFSCINSFIKYFFSK